MRAEDGIVFDVAGIEAERIKEDAEYECVLVQPEMERRRSPLVSIPPYGRGFSRHRGLPIRCDFGKSAKGDFRARLHRLHEPTRLPLGVVASPQSPLPFRPARSSQLHRVVRSQLLVCA